MSSVPLMPIHTWNVAQVGGAEDVHPVLDDEPVVDPVGEDVPAKMPGAPVPSRSVQNGASTLLGRAGSGPVGQVAAVVVLRACRRRRRGSRWSRRRCRSTSARRRRTAATLKLMISSSPIGIGRDAEGVEREVAGQARPGPTDGTPGWRPASGDVERLAVAVAGPSVAPSVPVTRSGAVDLGAEVDDVSVAEVVGRRP